MIPDGLILVPLVLILVAIAVLWTGSRRRQQLRMPAGETVYQDTAEKPGELLVSHTHQLKGKPDYLIRQQVWIIPVEAKTGRTPKQPYHGHVMQLIAYCLLVEETTHIRPPHGIIRYPEQSFTIEFTPEREQALLTLLAEMRQQRTIEAHRNHQNPNLCNACGFKGECDERLSAQARLI